MLLAEVELLSLEHKNWLDLSIDLKRLEPILTHVVCHTEFKHIKQMVCEHSAHDHVVGSLLLVCSQDKHAASLFLSELLKRTDVVEGMQVVAGSHEKLVEVGASLLMDVLHQVHENRGCLVTLDYNALLGVLDQLGLLAFKNLPSLMSLCSPLDYSK